MSFFLYMFGFIYTMSGITIYQRRRNSKDFKSKFSHFVVILLTILPLTLFAAFRSFEVGNDTYGIYYIYWFRPFCQLNMLYAGREYGFYLLIRLGNLLFRNYNGMLFIVSFFTISTAITGFANSKHSKYLPYCFFLYLSFLFFDSFNIQRQLCALSVLLIGLIFLERDKIIYYILSVAIASLFHNSAIIGLTYLVFYLYRNKEHWMVRKIIHISILFLPFILPTIMIVLRNFQFFDKYVRLYGNLDFQISLKNLALVVYNLPAYYVIYRNRKKLYKKDKFNYVLLAMTLMGFSCNLFKVSMVWISRLAIYFTIAHCFLLPQCIEFYRRNKKIYKLFLVIYGVSYFILFYIILKNNSIYPYFFDIY